MVIQSQITQQPLTLPAIIITNFIKGMCLANIVETTYCVHLLLEHNSFLHHIKIMHAIYPNLPSAPITVENVGSRPV